MYKVVDKKSHELESGDKLEMYRGENVQGGEDIWCVDILGINGQTKWHWRYATRKEAELKYNYFTD